MKECVYNYDDLLSIYFQQCYSNAPNIFLQHLVQQMLWEGWYDLLVNGP